MSGRRRPSDDRPQGGQRHAPADVIGRRPVAAQVAAEADVLAGERPAYCPGASRPESGTPEIGASANSMPVTACGPARPYQAG